MWTLANDKEEIGQLFTQVGSTIISIRHHYSQVDRIFARAAVPGPAIGALPR